MSILSRRAGGAAAIVAFALCATRAFATEGYFQEGVSPREKALGGAGVADSKDALTIANNPAGLVDVQDQFQANLSLFAPNRKYDASGTMLVAPGSIKSSREAFGIPSLGYARHIDADRAFGFAIYGNGGMNTDYKSGTCGFGAPGVFCAGKTGVDLNQAFISAAYAQRFGALSVGVAPVLAAQMFKAYGLGGFTGLSAHPGAMTNRGADMAFGGGLRLGAQYKVTPNFRVGLSGSTPIWSQRFTKYEGLFAQRGMFDIPASVAAGLAYDVTPALTVMVDYKHIFYGSVRSIANSSVFTGFNQMGGGANAPGFGWKDVDVISLGLEWRASDKLTLRAGYAHNTQPIRSRDVTFNILAPGVMTDHFSGGFSYVFAKNAQLDAALVYAPRASVSGPETIPNGMGVSQVVPGSKIKLSMTQIEATLGLTWKFDSAAPAGALVRKY